MVIWILFTVWAFVLYWLWARVINHLASLHKKRLWVHIFLIWGISTVLIWQFPKVIAYLWVNQEKFINTLDVKTILAYAAYMVVLWIVIYIAYVRKIRKKGYFIKIVSFVLLFAILLIWWLFLKLPNYVLYFSIVAFIEEFVKYVFGYSLFDKYKLHYTDLILFCLISSFAFALIENWVYVYYSIQKLNIQWRLPQFFEAGKIMTQRWFINISVHTLFTGLIWLLTLSPILKKNTKIPNEISADVKDKNISLDKNENTKKEKTDLDVVQTENESQNEKQVSISFGKIIFGIILWVGIHAVFNISTATGIVFTLPIVVLGWYIFLSYLFYKSDSFFVKGEE